MNNTSICKPVRLGKLDDETKCWFFVMRKIIVRRLKNSGLPITPNLLKRVNYHIWNGKSVYQTSCLLSNQPQ